MLNCRQQNCLKLILTLCVVQSCACFLCVCTGMTLRQMCGQQWPP